MVVFFKLNKIGKMVLDKGEIKLERSCFPIKVKIINNKGKESERLIFVREKNGESKMMIS